MCKISQTTESFVKLHEIESILQNFEELGLIFKFCTSKLIKNPKNLKKFQKLKFSKKKLFQNFSAFQGLLILKLRTFSFFKFSGHFKDTPQEKIKFVPRILQN